MIDHLSTYAIDYERTKTFYESVFTVLGYSVIHEAVTDWDKEFPTRRICAFGSKGSTMFWVIETTVNYTPRHLAFRAQSRQLVEEFYSQAINSGGVDHGKPGLRPEYHEHYYGAFVLDPDGNNVEAVCHKPPTDWPNA